MKSSHWKLTITTAIIKTYSLTTTQEVAEELNINHSTAVQHLKQTGKVKKLTKWVSHELSKNLKTRHFELSSYLLHYTTMKNHFSMGLWCAVKSRLWHPAMTRSVVKAKFSSVQCIHSVMSDSLRPHGLKHARLPCSSSSRSLLKLMSTESVMPFNHLILCCPLLLLPSIFPSITVFFNKSVLYIRWPKYWSFSIGPSNEHSGLISFRTDWLDLPAVQRTLKSLLQHHSSKVSVLWCSAFFIVQLSHPYMTTRKTVTLTRQTFVDKIISLLFNTLSRLVIAFLPRSKPNLHQRKVMVTVWWSAASLIHQNFLNPSETITSEKCAQQINEIHLKLWCLQLALVIRKGPILHDNTWPHVTQTTLQNLNELGYDVLPHPPWFLTSCQATTTSSSILTIICRENAFQVFTESQSMDFYATGISKLISHWQKKHWL